jgi:hypothetical protein
MAADRPITETGARRIRVEHSCGFPLLGVQVTGCGKVGRLYVQFRALAAEGGVAAGQAIRHCPRCREILPSMSWQRFADEMAEAWGA